jgi:hypothetical protein
MQSQTELKHAQRHKGQQNTDKDKFDNSRTTVITDNLTKTHTHDET